MSSVDLSLACACACSLITDSSIVRTFVCALPTLLSLETALCCSDASLSPKAFLIGGCYLVSLVDVVKLFLPLVVVQRALKAKVNLRR